MKLSYRLRFRPSHFSLLLLTTLLVIGCENNASTEGVPPNSQAPESNKAANDNEKTDKPEKPQFVETPVDTDSDFTAEDGFRTLTLTDFEVFSKDPDTNKTTPTWTEAEGIISCSGSPRGYIYSKESFADYVLKLDLKFLPPAKSKGEKELLKHNTGIMIHIQDDHRTWPPSLEVQGKQLDMASIKSNGGIPDLIIEDSPEHRQTARKPIGEWNSFEVRSEAGRLTATLNGIEICRSQAGELTSGSIGFQAEDWPFRIRRVRIRTTSNPE